LRISTAPCGKVSPRTGTGSIPPCRSRPMPRSPTTTCGHSTTSS
jgi:hypothetical protein